MVPEIVSRPGKDILQGVDALVKDGIADPDHLAVGGYSYGGYMTNWLITQTTRFKAAVTGAGAVENVANWGNDDLTLDDANDLGGRPWEVPQRYNSEAAIFQIDKVKTPTHMVAGDRRYPGGGAGELFAGSRPAFSEHSQHAAYFSGRRPLTRPESVARQNQSARRVEVAAEIWRNFGHDACSLTRCRL